MKIHKTGAAVFALVPWFLSAAMCAAGARATSPRWASYAGFWTVFSLALGALSLFSKPFLKAGGRDLAVMARVARHPGGSVLTASALALFFELALTRYHSSANALFGYFKNISLLAGFLGLGIGFALGDRPGNYLPVSVVLLGFQVGFLYGVRSFLPPFLNPIRETYTMGVYQATRPSEFVYAYSFVGLVFFTTALTMIPLGHATARAMSKLEPLRAYSWNLAGSLLGTGLFSLMTATATPPAVWFGAGLLGVAWLLDSAASTYWPALACAFATLIVEALDPLVFRAHVLKIFTPYQVVTLDFRPNPAGAALVMNVNHDYFQRIFDLSSPVRVQASPALQRVAWYYEFPYAFCPPSPHVLVAGAGTGNDVAAALRRGAAHVDAVEIDPKIAEVGAVFHPEAPYSSPRVTVRIQDARVFFRTCPTSAYDLVVYGLLDSHTLLGGPANVRLDSFIYTVEAFREARRVLKPSGTFALAFSLMHDRQGQKLYKMLREAFPDRPLRCFRCGYDGGVMFLVANTENDFPAVSEAVALEDVTARFAADLDCVDSSTDDWPFFYMSRRTYPMSYLAMNLFLLGLSVVAIARFLPLRGVGGRAQFFWLGAAFLLIETRGITELALTFGNTWHVLSAVIAAILLVAFAANLSVIALPRVSVGLVYALLLVLLSVEAAFRMIAWAGSLVRPWGPLLQLLVLAAPFFFSGLIFSTEFRRVGNVAAVFSANLLGSMVGGFLEYNAMWTGYLALSWLALALYAFAFLAWLKGRGT